MPSSTITFEKNPKGFLKEPLVPAKVTWTDASGSERFARGEKDGDFYPFWTLDSGEIVKWGHLLNTVIGIRAQRTMTLESAWVS